MKIKHRHIREALLAWAAGAGGEKIPASRIVGAWFTLGLTGLSLYDGSHPDALSRNTQKIFRWIKSDTPASQEKVQILLPAIEKSMPVFLLAKMRSHSSTTCRELIERKERIEREMEALVGAIISLSDRMEGGGPAGSVLTH